jgi:PadR family transcriptional regulator PadR
MCDHHSEDKKMSGCRCGGGLPVEKFMQPCLLLLLKQRSAHGYDLIQLLPEFGFSDRLDPGSVYRTV